MHKRKSWTEPEIERLKQEFPKHSNKELCELLNRSASSIKAKIHRLGLTNRQRDLKPSNLTPEEAAYIAGFLDGEGSFRFNIVWKNNIPTRAVPLIEVSNSNKEVLDWVTSCIQTSGRWKTKAVYKAPENRYLKPHFIYHLTISGRWRVKGLLVPIMPFLRVKRKPAECLLKFLDTHRYGKYPEDEWRLILRNRDLINSRKTPAIQSREKLRRWINKTYGSSK